MCFAPEVDLIGGAVITVIGIDALRHVGDRRELIGLAALPLLFGLHQLVETFVWWGLRGNVPATVGDVAMWIYLLFAFVVLPTYVPVAVYVAEPAGSRRRIIAGFVVLGVVVSTALLVAMIEGPVAAELAPWHLRYSTNLSAGLLVVAAYIAAVCGSFVVSGIRNLQWFGIVNLVAVAAVAATVINGFASIWCAWAAVMSALFALHLRFSRTESSDERASLVTV